MFDGSRIPILKIEEFLVASVQVELSDQSAVAFKENLLTRIYETKAKGLILDLTAVEVVDSFMARIINEVGAMAGLMGTRVVITGLQPAVAITLVELGLQLQGVQTALNLEKGIVALRRMIAERAD
ncbi:MAG: STAS domain-containing protein [Anaerolineae bacterium]|nr:STAS domain-containing protein [Anaerolineae bacterium]